MHQMNLLESIKITEVSGSAAAAVQSGIGNVVGGSVFATLQRSGRGVWHRGRKYGCPGGRGRYCLNWRGGTGAIQITRGMT